MGGTFPAIFATYAIPPTLPQPFASKVPALQAPGHGQFSDDEGCVSDISHQSNVGRSKHRKNINIFLGKGVFNQEGRIGRKLKRPLAKRSPAASRIRIAVKRYLVCFLNPSSYQYGIASQEDKAVMQKLNTAPSVINRNPKPSAIGRR